jgi:hypothetical protein
MPAPERCTKFVKVKLRKTRFDQSPQHPREGDEGYEYKCDYADEGNGTVSVRHDVPISPYHIEAQVGLAVKPRDIGVGRSGRTMARSGSVPAGGLELILKALNKFAKTQQFHMARAKRGEVPRLTIFKKQGTKGPKTSEIKIRNATN